MFKNLVAHGIRRVVILRMVVFVVGSFSACDCRVVLVELHKVNRKEIVNPVLDPSGLTQMIV